MRELHVVALSEDGRHVVLATRPGTASGEFRVALDDRLAAAVRGELPAPGRDAPPSISPRDIQARLRDGEAPEDIAASAGVPLSRVERYAGPVLAELDRMIGGARAAVVSRPRLGASARPLGEAVETHLAEMAHLAEGSVRWSARRTEFGRWIVEVSWTARGRRRTAGWHYDPATHEVVAVDGPSAVLGHVEADAAPAPATARSARPAARGPRSTATGAARPAAAGRAVPAAATPTSPTSSTSSTSSISRPAASGSSPSTARPPIEKAGADARTSSRPTGSPRATTRTTSRQATSPQTTTRQATAPQTTAPAAPTRRRTTTPPAAAESPTRRRTSTAAATTAASTAAAAGARTTSAPTAAAPATRRRPSPPAAPEPRPAAATAPTRRAPTAGTSAEQRPARRTAATGQPTPRRATSRRSAVPSFEDLTAPGTDTPAHDAPAAAAPTPAAAAPTPTAAAPTSAAGTVAAPTSAAGTAGTPTPAAAPTPAAGAPTPPPSGPPVLRVVPPAEPEPAPEVDDALEQRPVRRAAGGRDWADVLMGSAPPAEPRSD